VAEPWRNDSGTRLEPGWALGGPQTLCALRLAPTKRILTRIPPRKQFDRREKKTIHAKPSKTMQSQKYKAKQGKAQQDKANRASQQFKKDGAKAETWWNHGGTMAEPGRSQGGPRLSPGRTPEALRLAPGFYNGNAGPKSAPSAI